MTTAPRLAVVDHGAGNLVSISQGLERVGAEVTVADRGAGLLGADGIVLPGVGSMAAVMDGIRRGGFDDVLADPQVPLLGICVGMQVLFDGSEEGDAEGLGVIGGTVRRLAEAPTLPHMGWNDIEPTGRSDVFNGLPRPVVYFAHSYAAEPADLSLVTAWTTHGARFVAGARQDLSEGVQFHPERSGANGLRILSRFVTRCREIPDAA